MLSNKQSDHQVEIPRDAVDRLQQTALLKGLMAVAAGFAAGSAQPKELKRASPPECLLMYCIRGSGWCEASGFLRAFRQGDLVVVSPPAGYTCNTRSSQPWAIHWIRALGELIPDYLAAMGQGAPLRVYPVGDSLELSRFFNEARSALERGTDFRSVLRASQAVCHMLAVLTQGIGGAFAMDRSTPHKVAETIVYMSEHLHEPLRIPALARMANLAPTYFTALFKQQTGCAPRDYLHLLRIHRACQFLSGTDLSIKQIATRIGYQDPFHFSRQFKAFQGVSPSEYRETASWTGAGEP